MSLSLFKLSICTGLRAHIAGSTIAKLNTVKVEFMLDEFGAIFVSMQLCKCCYPAKGLFVDTEES